jgi:cytoskeleton protein RodZ
MEELGKLLKEERLKKSLTLQEVALVLKINIKVLQAIEDNNANLMPPKAYIRGFVKSYADYLKLDTKKIIETYFSTTQTKPENLASNIRTVKSLEEDKEIVDNVNKSKPILGSIIVTLTLIGLIAVCLKILNKYQQEAKTETESVDIKTEVNPQTNSVNDTISNLEKKEIETNIEQDSEPNIKKDQERLDNNLPKTNMETGVNNQTTATSTTSTVTSTTVNQNITAEKQPVKNNSASIKNSELLIEATEDITITLTTLEGKSETVSILKDESKAFKVVGQIMLKTNNAGATFISVNGVDKGSLGSVGASKEIKVP